MKIIIFCYFVFVAMSNDTNIGKFYCNNITSCSYNGVCNLNNTQCICNNGFVTYNSPNIQCNYKQKEYQITYFLSIFLGFLAIDHWYINNYIIAGQKLVVNLINFYLIGYFKYKNNNNNNNKNILGIILFSLISFIWWVSDIILFNLNYYTDGNNINLYYS